jgi:NAD(P)-dependent dehydrogenase (short-subunit alcohol dehydrogenase family)
MSRSLKDKVVLITGASIGIGRATAIGFAQQGCRVAVTYYMDEREAQHTAARCTEFGAPEVLLTELNVMDNRSIHNCVERVIERYKGIDILINNAGTIIWKELKDQSLEEIETQIRTNLEGTIKITKICLPHIREMIISTSGPTSYEGRRTLAPYSASKAGVPPFIESLAQELWGVDAYTVIPGVTATRMTNYRGDPPERVAEVLVALARGEYNVRSGEEIRVFDPPARVVSRLLEEGICK